MYWCWILCCPGPRMKVSTRRPSQWPPRPQDFIELTQCLLNYLEFQKTRVPYLPRHERIRNLEWGVQSTVMRPRMDEGWPNRKADRPSRAHVNEVRARTGTANLFLQGITEKKGTQNVRIVGWLEMLQHLIFMNACITGRVTVVAILEQNMLFGRATIVTRPVWVCKK